ncbi:MAG: divalent-cation tolerance protein CutA [Gammaproteobacteria bacterium]|nr:divalent-cation tolerance protein CutA [Gammaproteobacteria bacterium]
MSNPEHCVVYVTCPTEAKAGQIASALVEEKLAACANIVPGLRSVYAWQGRIENDPEVLLIIKSRIALLDALTARVNELHDYDVPEVIALPIIGGSKDYLDWLAEETARDTEEH